MLRVTTLRAGSAAVTAGYYTRYLTEAPGEHPGVWLGAQADAFGLVGEVSPEALERLLAGCDPVSGATLGYPLKDRTWGNGRVVREVERFGATTRVRSNGRRLHLDSRGLVVAAFRQSTSRLDDPQLHTHLVISGKVQTADGRWLALDARVLKQHQRALGGLYQSVLRAELTRRYGVAFEQIVNGQAEIAGIPTELLEVFSKRAVEVQDALEVKLAGFVAREGRDPTRLERAAMEREASADTRRHKTGAGVPDLRSRWLSEAAAVGLTPPVLTAAIVQAARTQSLEQPAVSVADVLGDLAGRRSAWHRMDVLRAVTDRFRPRPDVSGEHWALLVEEAVDRVLAECIQLDPAGGDGQRRRSDGRSVWIEPVAAQVTSREVIGQEEAIIAWTLDTQLDPPSPSATITAEGLDVLQADAAAAVAGGDRLVVVVGPAGAGKTTMLRTAVNDLHQQGRGVFGVAPTAKAARVLERETGMSTDTVAKLLHEWAQPAGPQPVWRLPEGATLIVDEAGMVSTPDLHHLTQLATTQGWRLVLVGDHRQVQAVGRGGMFAEIATTARTIELERIHRFTIDWEATASLRLRHGDPTVLDTYQVHGRIIPGSLEEHLDPSRTVQAADGVVMVGDVIATRRNQRQLTTNTGDIVRNRELWTVTNITGDGHLTVTQPTGSTVTLPAAYVLEHVRLGYAATEHGNQSDTQTASITLATPATTGRGLYVAMTRGRTDNTVHVVTAGRDVGEARDVLEHILTTDRADLPAITQRRNLQPQQRPVDRRPMVSWTDDQPTRHPIPDWFPELRADIARQAATIRRELDTITVYRDRLAAAVDTAYQHLANAVASTQPFDHAIANATNTLREAEHTQRRTIERLDGPLRGRRQARHDHANATALVSIATDRLEQTRRDAAPAYQVRHKALQQHADARDLLAEFDHSHPTRSLATRLQQLDQQHTALNKWHHWAIGQEVSTTQLSDTFHQLRAFAAVSVRVDGPTSGHHIGYEANIRELADVLHHWAAKEQLDLTPEVPTLTRPQRRIETPSLGLR